MYRSILTNACVLIFMLAWPYKQSLCGSLCSCVQATGFCDAGPGEETECVHVCVCVHVQARVPREQYAISDDVSRDQWYVSTESVCEDTKTTDVGELNTHTHTHTCISPADAASAYVRYEDNRCW